MKLVTQFGTTLAYVQGVKPENKNPLKERNKHEYNIVIHPFKGKNESSLDCLMPTHSHPHIWVSSMAYPKSQSMISYVDISTSKI